MKHIGYIPGLSLWAGGFFLFLYLPITVLLVYSFNVGDVAQLWEGFSWRWYPLVLANADIQQATYNSLIVASAATILASSLATLAALSLSRGSAFRGSHLAYSLLNLPLLIPAIATAIATLIFFSVTGLSLGLGNLIIAHTVQCIPFAFLPIQARLKGMGNSLEQAGQDLYASDWQVFRHITLPLLAPGILAGAMLSFIVSLDDFIISLMVAEAGSSTLPLYIYSMIRVGITPEVNAVSALLLGISLLFIGLYFWLSRRSTSPF